MIIYKDFQQGSLEWLEIRLGKVTGSRVKDALSSNNLTLIDKMIAEKVSEDIEESYVNAAMQRGHDMEPVARKKFEEHTGKKVEEAAFLVSKKYSWLGHSPDGLIASGKKYTEGIEIKCPSTHTHVKYIRMGGIPSEHKGQVLNFFLVAQDLEKVHFISYDDRFRVKPLHMVTVTREEVKDELIELENSLVKFHEKFEKYYNEILF